MEIMPYQHEVKYYECDGMRITHHSNYVRFMEEARVDWMDQLGYGFERVEADGVVSPIMSISVDYKRPTKFKDIISVYVSVTEMSAMKISFSYTMMVGDIVVCTASSKHCFLENNRPVVIEKRFPQLYERIKSLMITEE